MFNVLWIINENREESDQRHFSEQLTLAKLDVIISALTSFNVINRYRSSSGGTVAVIIVNYC